MQIGALIQELNELLADTDVDVSCHDSLVTKLTPNNLAVFQFLPTEVRQQLLLDRDPHGNVQVFPLFRPVILLITCHSIPTPALLDSVMKAGLLHSNHSTEEHSQPLQQLSRFHLCPIVLVLCQSILCVLSEEQQLVCSLPMLSH